MIDLAAEYAEECAELNARMRRIVELLHAGQISEATNLADTEPAVLEKFAELDFPELNDWFSLLLSQQLDPPPPLLLDLAAEIDQAYADKDSLSDLLRMQRLLALRRAPLKNRLETLRQLVAMQPDNPLWRSDVLALEEARLKEITIAAKKAKRDKDIVTVNSLLYELNTQWSISIPSQLIDSVYELKAQFESDRAREQLANINQSLNRCLSEFNVEEAQRLRAKWNELVEPARLGQSEPLATEVAEVFAWLEVEEREAQLESSFQGQLRQLENGLDQKLPFDQIEKLYFNTLQFDREIPQVLESRYRIALENYQIQAKRKFQFNIAVSVLAVVLAAAAIFYVIRSVQYSGRKSEAIASLQKAVNEEEWGRGVEIYSNLEKSLAEEPVIIELGNKVRQGNEEENTRLANLTAIIRQIENAPMDPPPTSLITKAQELAKDDDERGQIEVLELEVRTCQQQLLKDRNEEFVSKFNQASSDLASAEKKALESLDTTEINKLLTTFGNLKRDYSGTRYGYPMASSTLLEKIDPLMVRCGNITRSIQEKQKLVAELAKIDRAVGNPAQFKVALENYKSAFPSSPAASDFAIVIDELQYAEDWNEVSILSHHRTLISDEPVDSQAATQILELVSESKKERPGFPFYDEFQKASPRLKEISDLDHKAILDGLNPLLQWYPLTSLWVMKDDQDRRIYVPLEPKVENGKINTYYFESIPNRASDNSKKRLFTDIKTTMKAPHVKLVSLVSNKLKEINSVGFENAMLNAIEVCLSSIPGPEQPEIIVRAFVLRGLLKSCSKGNPLLAAELKPWIDQLEQIGLDRNRKGEAGDWVAVSNSKANLMRGVLNKFFIEIKAKLKLDSLRNLAGQAGKIPSIKPMPQVEWRGILMRRENGHWQVRSKSPIPPGTELFCLLKTGSTFDLTSIGNNPNEPKIISARNGRPVYTLRESKSN